ncbi:hypothetical protein CPC08DRAFT_762905 [Agrocybe pediades]|nr:hypothetical protein CPC08DRAFT_762905 [Agrocybe pediades]
MEPTRKGTPISMLHEDLLWKIFLEITNDALFYPFYPSRTENRPIVTIRYCSHVCDRWRSVILSSSMIWGRLIDMDYLTGRNTDSWMKEVVSRTGTALLWMYGTVDYQFPCDHFLFHFLRENWGRVQMLVVIESPHYLEHRKKMWDFLHRPAPRLQWVDLKLWFEDTEFLSRLLFADNAPLLTDFRIGNIRKFSTDTSWISNLCDVRFTYAFHPSEILEALRRIPRLKYLEVFIGNGAVDYRGPMIILPRLRMLQFHAGNFTHAGTFLQHIAPSADRC